jgi:RNA polymerase sigma-70 factor (ECF subfamily)
MNVLDDNINLIDLVKKAQFGCQESMDSLAQRVQRGLFAYIYRLTLNYNVSEDLQQETLLEMVKSLTKLEHPDRFWAWLYRTALGKVQHYFRDRQYERVIQPMSGLDKERLLQRVSGSYGEGLKNLIKEELGQAIVDAMAKLRLRHRNILVLRCCEQLPYSEIAEVMDCSEMAAQVLFFRAKHSLKRKLSKHGFGKGMLLGALGLFGQMTTPADAAAVTVSAASTKVGVVATVIGAAGTKLGLTVATMVAAAAITVGAITGGIGGIITHITGEPAQRSEIKSIQYAMDSGYNQEFRWPSTMGVKYYKYWLYFPDGIDGPMFTRDDNRVIEYDQYGNCWLYNGEGIYWHVYVHPRTFNTVFIQNHHALSISPTVPARTRCLPSDPPEFVDFLSQVEGKIEGLEYTYDPDTGVVVSVLDSRSNKLKNPHVQIAYSTGGDEAVFQYPWSPDVPVVDLRDVMHKRGWTYFTVRGRIGRETVFGAGRIPFVYAASRQHWPWLRLKMGDRLEIIDSPDEALVYDGQGTVVASYPGGSFFKGLARPWMGMHTLDIVRRDAVDKRLWFETKFLERVPEKLYSALDYYEDELFNNKAQVVIANDRNNPTAKLTYIIDVQADVVESIGLATYGEAGNDKKGILKFEYLQELGQIADEFVEPTQAAIQGETRKADMGMSWLIKLAQGTLDQ